MKAITIKSSSTKKNMLVSIATGLIVCAIAAYGLINFKAYEKPVRTSSKPSKKKLVDHNTPSGAATAALYQNYDSLLPSNI